VNLGTVRSHTSLETLVNFDPLFSHLLFHMEKYRYNRGADNAVGHYEFRESRLRPCADIILEGWLLSLISALMMETELFSEMLT
jgi:hypothetical protein